MSDAKKPGARPAEEAVERLARDKSAEICDQAKRLGNMVCRHIDLANADPRMWEAQDDVRVNSIVLDVTRPTPEEKLSRRVSGVLRFFVFRKFEHLQGTPEWLPNTHDVRLYLNVHGNEIPDDMEQASSDPVVQVIRFEEAHEYPDDQCDPRQQPYAASYYEGGSRFDAQDTEAIIDILAFLAEKASYKDGPPASVEG